MTWTKSAAKPLIFFLLAVVAFAIFVHFRALSRENAAEARWPMQGQLVDVDGIKVHAVVEGSGPDLVLIHGSSGNTRDFTFSLSAKLAKSFRVIIFDRPGLGYTETFNPSGETIFEQAALLANAAAQLGAQKPLVLGQSYGGAVALAWAVERPDATAGLILVSSPSQVWPGPLSRFYRVTSSWLGQKLAIPLMTAFVPNAYIEDSIAAVFAPATPPEGYSDYIAAGLTARRVSLAANARHRGNLKGEIAQLVPLYETIKTPVELIHAPDDTTVPLEIHAVPLAGLIEGANLTLTPGAGHMPHHLAQPALIDAIERAATRAGLR